MAADEHERRRCAEQLYSTRVGADQERQALDRRVATDVEEDRAAGPEGSELLVAVGDAARPAAFVPAARLLDLQQGAAPRPGPQPPVPSLCVAPARRRSCLDPAQHCELGPVQLAKHGQRGEARYAVCWFSTSKVVS
jgi:hypothetical protein